MSATCLIDTLNAVIDGQKQGAPQGTWGFLYVTAGFYLQPFDLAAISSEFDALEINSAPIPGERGRYRGAPVYPVRDVPKDLSDVGECHNVMFSFVRMTCLD